MGAKKKTTKKKTVKKTAVVVIPDEVVDEHLSEGVGKLTGSDLSNAGIQARKRSMSLRDTIKAMLPKGVIDDLQREVLENWVEMLQSDDMRIWAVATKEISKYLFPQKREHQIVPKVSIYCEFNGIKTDDAMAGKIINNQSETKLLEQVKTDLLAQVAQVDIILHGRKGKGK